MKTQIYYLSQTGQPPSLEIFRSSGRLRRIPFVAAGPGRRPDEQLWLAAFDLQTKGNWRFRIALENGRYDAPEWGEYYTTGLHTFWLQDGQIFNYRPAPAVSPSRVVKVPEFNGSLPARPLYIYLPRGYDEQITRFYPVLYMHDGQNCFEAFAEDSFAGSWRADQTADSLIGQGQMRECIIVGVGNGGDKRVVEYLPPYARCSPLPAKPLKTTRRNHKHSSQPPPNGQAGRTLAYYRDDVAQYLAQRYRILTGREHTATCGSSMGGLFTTYIAWEHPEFARHHAAMSPSYWMTRTGSGNLEIVERLRTGEPRDIRLWLDSGTQTSPGEGDDGRFDTVAARDALLENGYILGPDFQYHLDEAGIHSEASWAARLHFVFRFLFPLNEMSNEMPGAALEETQVATHAQKI